jgi:uncharacterized protein with HEPN domain
MYLEDMAESIEKILGYTKGMTATQFTTDRKTVDSVCFNLAVLGEAANKISPEFQKSHASIHWRVSALPGPRTTLALQLSNRHFTHEWRCVKPIDHLGTGSGIPSQLQRFNAGSVEQSEHDAMSASRPCLGT